MKKKFLTWLRAAGVRAIKTVAQTAVATIGTGAVISEVDWRMVLSASILAGVLSLLTSVAGLPEINAAGTDGAQTNEAEQGGSVCWRTTIPTSTPTTRRRQRPRWRPRPPCSAACRLGSLRRKAM